MPRENRSMVSSITDSRLADPEAYEVTCAHRYSAKRTPPRKRLRLRLPFVLYIFNPFLHVFQTTNQFFLSATFDAIDSAKEIVTAVEHSRDKVDFKKRFSLKGIVYICFIIAA